MKTREPRGWAEEQNDGTDQDQGQICSCRRAHTRQARSDWKLRIFTSEHAHTTLGESGALELVALGTPEQSLPLSPCTHEAVTD